MRAFIALELPQEIKTALFELQDKLRAEGRDFVAWVRGEGIHLTLKFLGDVSEDQLPPIKDALAIIAQRGAPLSLELSMTGLFPNPQHLRVVWVGLAGDIAGLVNLQQQIEQALIPLGFPTEARPFSAHLTLGRLKETTAEAGRRFGQQVLALPVARTSFQVRLLTLMQSQLNPHGAIYTTLAQFPLGGT
ncbi:MAG: RNA 2',3'-cyclic phosphodiesterase [Chloroflexota bacterium]